MPQSLECRALPVSCSIDHQLQILFSGYKAHMEQLRIGPHPFAITHRLRFTMNGAAPAVAFTSLRSTVRADDYKRSFHRSGSRRTMKYFRLTDASDAVT